MTTTPVKIHSVFMICSFSGIVVVFIALCAFKLKTLYFSLSCIWKRQRMHMEYNGKGKSKRLPMSSMTWKHIGGLEV
jgi:hypothetical protein